MCDFNEFTSSPSSMKDETVKEEDSVCSDECDAFNRMEVELNFEEIAESDVFSGISSFSSPVAASPSASSSSSPSASLDFIVGNYERQLIGLGDAHSCNGSDSILVAHNTVGCFLEDVMQENNLQDDGSDTSFDGNMGGYSLLLDFEGGGGGIGGENGGFNQENGGFNQENGGFHQNSPTLRQNPPTPRQENSDSTHPPGVSSHEDGENHHNLNQESNEMYFTPQANSRVQQSISVHPQEGVCMRTEVVELSDTHPSRNPQQTSQRLINEPTNRLSEAEQSSEAASLINTHTEAFTKTNVINIEDIALDRASSRVSAASSDVAHTLAGGLVDERLSASERMSDWVADFDDSAVCVNRVESAQPSSSLSNNLDEPLSEEAIRTIISITRSIELKAPASFMRWRQ